MSYVGAEKDINSIDLSDTEDTITKIDLLIGQLAEAIAALYQIDKQFVKILLKFISGDHHGLGHLLSHKMSGPMIDAFFREPT